MSGRDRLSDRAGASGGAGRPRGRPAPPSFEGIGDAEEHGRMRGLGREFGQGFHFARPMAGDEVTEFLTRGS